MKKLRSIVASVLAVGMLLTVTAFAAETNTIFNDVPADSWYAEAASYVRDNGIMNGISAGQFSPNGTMTRAMLATVLYRVAGSPPTAQTTAFTDVDSSAYYANAVAWASTNSIVTGYGNGRFGSNDPVTREQIATILWRYDGSKEADTSADFTDSASIHDYAILAVNWTVENGIVTGMSDGSFAPTASATRAQVAVILHRYLNQNNTEQPSQPKQDGKTLVAYFSASGSTEAVAKTIAKTLNADLFEITPANPYTSADLDWTDSSSRVNAEHENLSQRNVSLTTATVENWDEYDTVLIGYPIWWGIAAWPTNGFVSANDFSGKTVIPFCTSTSSGIGQSGELLAQLAGTGDWQSGQRFRSSVDAQTVIDWVNGLELN